MLFEKNYTISIRIWQCPLSRFGCSFTPFYPSSQGPGSGGGPSSVGGLGVGNMVGGMVGAASDGSVVGGIGTGKCQLLYNFQFSYLFISRTSIIFLASYLIHEPVLAARCDVT